MKKHATNAAKAVVSNTKDWKSTAVGSILAGAHVYQHFALGADLSIETLFAAGYIILGVAHGKK